jgi:hypothetical protein
MSIDCAMVEECERQAESCLYTSTTFFLWLRSRRRIRTLFIVLPLACGAIAGSTLLTGSDDFWAKLVAGVFAIVAGVLPSIYSALKYDDELADAAALAGEFKNLQDGFRQAALIGAQRPLEEFTHEFRSLMARLDAARQRSLTAPERFFKQAQAKIGEGHYSFDADARRGSTKQ